MKTLLFTGSSGFLGRNILPFLQENYTVSTLDIRQADHTCDLSKSHCAFKESFDIVLHAAGKAHSIPRSKVEEHVFFDINYQGTVNLCKSLELAGVPRSFIFISTVAVYGCEQGMNITEDYPRNGTTPYASSKIQAEDYLIEWCKKHDVRLSILRPSLIAGTNPPGNMGSMINGIQSGKYFSIAGGKARKSVLLAQDIAYLVPLLIGKDGIYNVCDDESPTFSQLEEIIAKQLGKKKPISIPYFLAKIIALCGDLVGNKIPINSNQLSKITRSLTFSNQKAKATGWKPLNVVENFRIS
jgi:nucleoside-diphosphate-sugar epimerase